MSLVMAPLKHFGRATARRVLDRAQRRGHASAMRAFLATAAVLTAFAIVACRPAHLRVKEYVYPAWGFKASFQTPPETKEEPAAADGSTLHNFLAEAHTHNHDFFVAAFDVRRDNPGVDAFADSVGPAFAKAIGGEAEGHTYVATFEDLMGREIPIDKDGKPFATMRVFQAGGRYYEVVAVSNYGPSDPAVNDFLYSFHAIDAKGAVTNDIEPAAPAANAASPSR
jgi:hypothetical protein